MSQKTREVAQRLRESVSEEMRENNRSGYPPSLPPRAQSFLARAVQRPTGERDEGSFPRVPLCPSPALVSSVLVAPQVLRGLRWGFSRKVAGPPDGVARELEERAQRAHVRDDRLICVPRPGGGWKTGNPTTTHDRGTPHCRLALCTSCCPQQIRSALARSSRSAI